MIGIGRINQAGAPAVRGAIYEARPDVANARARLRRSPSRALRIRPVILFDMACRTRRRIVASIAFAIVAGFAFAGAAAPEIDRAADAGRAWKGRFCTQPGCSESRTAPWSHVAGFGAAVAATGLLARRRD